VGEEMKDKQPNPELEMIKQMYRDMLQVQQANMPERYVIPLSYYTAILKKIAHLEEALKNARESRECWRKRCMEAKK
jgi:hypothetical protein